MDYLVFSHACMYSGALRFYIYLFEWELECPGLIRERFRTAANIFTSFGSIDWGRKSSSSSNDPETTMRKSGYVEDGRKEWARRRRHLMESYAWCFRGLGIIVPLFLLLPSLLHSLSSS